MRIEFNIYRGETIAITDTSIIPKIDEIIELTQYDEGENRRITKCYKVISIRHFFSDANCSCEGLGVKSNDTIKITLFLL